MATKNPAGENRHHNHHQKKLTRSNTFVINPQPMGHVKRNNLGHYYISDINHNNLIYYHHHHHRTLPTRSCEPINPVKTRATQTLPLTESKSTSTDGDDSLNLVSTEFITPHLGPGYYGDKECSTPSTVPLDSPKENPSLGQSRFQVNILKDRFRQQRKNTTNIYIDYSNVTGR